MSSIRSAATPAISAATRGGVEFSLHPYTVASSDDGYGLAAAEALNISPDEIFKTLIAEVDNGLAVAVVPVSRKLDLKSLAAARGGKKARMAEPAVAEKATGYVLGGISPLGQRKRIPTVVDQAITDHEAVYVSAGRRGLQMRISPLDLIALTAASVASITLQSQ